MTQTGSPPEWMTIEEVADYLKLSRSKLYDMAQNGEIPYSKVAGRCRFYRPEVDEWMFTRRRHAPMDSTADTETDGGE